MPSLNRFLILVLQVGASALAVLLAQPLMQLALLPPVLRKEVRLSPAHLLTILIFFVVFHLAFLLIALASNKAWPFSNLRRFTYELCFALMATSFASLALFLFTVVPFSANYYTWIYVVLLALYAAFYAVGRRTRKQRKEVETIGPRTSVVISLAVVTLVVVLSPAALAGLYKADRDFSNLVNELRATINTPTNPDWTLVQAFPGRRFEQPMYLAFESGQPSNLLVLSRWGRLYRYVTEPGWEEELLLDISREVGNIDAESGAYGFALHPEFNKPGSPNSGFVYLYYTSIGPDGHFNRLARFDLSLPTRAEREASKLLLMDLGRAPTGLHNGGTVLFDDDGFLYLSLGDYVMRDRTQRIDGMLIGGVLRIDVDRRGGDISAPIGRQPENGLTQGYYVPKDNPWYGVENALEEYWAIGFRNPFRMSVDSETDSIWLGDVGQASYEEHDVVRPGDNGQWPFMEGPEEYEERPDTVIGREIPPIYWYEHTALARAAVGGVIYRGDKHGTLRNLYVFADNQAGTVHALDPKQPASSARLIARSDHFGQLGITSILLTPDDEIYLTLLGSKNENSGEIVRLEHVPDR